MRQPPALEYHPRRQQRPLPQPVVRIRPRPLLTLTPRRTPHLGRRYQPRTERSHQMNIPEEAVEAAAKALAELEPGEDWPSNIDLGGHALLGTRDDEFKRAMEQDAKRDLTAALPHIEAALRKQIATDIRAVANGPTDWDDGYYEGRHDAARIAEEGTTK